LLAAAPARKPSTIAKWLAASSTATDSASVGPNDTVGSTVIGCAPVAGTGAK
jgi:hypothetical protein